MASPNFAIFYLFLTYCRNLLRLAEVVKIKGANLARLPVQQACSIFCRRTFPFQNFYLEQGKHQGDANTESFFEVKST